MCTYLPQDIEKIVKSITKGDMFKWPGKLRSIEERPSEVRLHQKPIPCWNFFFLSRKFSTQQMYVHCTTQEITRRMHVTQANRIIFPMVQILKEEAINFIWETWPKEMEMNIPSGFRTLWTPSSIAMTLVTVSGRGFHGSPLFTNNTSFKTENFPLY